MACGPQNPALKRASITPVSAPPRSSSSRRGGDRKAGWAGAGMVRHGGGLLQRAAVFQVGRDAGRPERMIAQLGRNAGGGSSHGYLTEAGG